MPISGKSHFEPKLFYHILKKADSGLNLRGGTPGGGREPSVRQTQATAPARNTPPSRKPQRLEKKLKPEIKLNLGFSGEAGVEPQRQQGAVT